MKRTQTIALGTMVVALFAVGALLLISVSDAPAQPIRPAIAWTPSTISETLLAGESRIIAATFEASEDVGAVDVWVVPELQPYITVSPQTLSVENGQSYSVDLKISTPTDALPMTLEGTVHLRKTGSTTTVARPLPIGVTVAWRRIELDSNVAVSYPPAWQFERTPSEELRDSAILASTLVLPNIDSLNGITLNVIADTLDVYVTSIQASLVTVIQEQREIAGRDWLVIEFADADYTRRYLNAFTQVGDKTYQVGILLDNDRLRPAFDEMLRSFAVSQ